MRVGNTARDARAVARDVVRLRTDIERYRTGLRQVFERFLGEHDPEASSRQSRAAGTWWLTSPRPAPTVQDMTKSLLLTEGDLDRGHPPDLTSPLWYCLIVHVATGAVCTRRPHGDGVEHKGYAAVQGTGRTTYLVEWIGGTERAMVVDSYSWSRLPGTDVEVRALTDKPLAVRYRPSRQA